MDNNTYDIHYKTEIHSGDVVLDPEGACSLSIENLGTVTAYVFDVIPIKAGMIREFTNEANCRIHQKIRITYKGTYSAFNPVYYNGQQILVVKTFSEKRK